MLGVEPVGAGDAVDDRPPVRGALGRGHDAARALGVEHVAEAERGVALVGGALRGHVGERLGRGHAADDARGPARSAGAAALAAAVEGDDERRPEQGEQRHRREPATRMHRRACHGPTLPHPGVSITSWACNSSLPPSFRRGWRWPTTCSSTATTSTSSRACPTAPSTSIYIDPPFNTGREQRRRSLRVVADDEGDRTGFAGRRYRTQEVGSLAYADAFEDYVGFLAPRLRHARRLLADHGTLYVHLDPRESHYVKVHLDGLFGRECFLNELVWAYDYGAKTRRRWPPKHDTILVYVKDPDALPLRRRRGGARCPTWRPGLVGPEKAAPRQAPHRHLVSHHRADQRAREDRLPDAEARGRRAPHRGRLVAPGRLVPGLLRRVGDARRGGARARAGASCSSTATPRRSTSRAGAWPATVRRSLRAPA